MDKRISTTEAQDHLAELLAEVSRNGAHVIIEDGGEALGALVSLSDLDRLQSHQRVASQPLGALALVGGWADLSDQDIDDFVRHVYAERAADVERQVSLDD